MAENDRNFARQAVAAPLTSPLKLNAADPSEQWKSAAPIEFLTDWQGKNPDPLRQTEVRVMWSAAALYLKFDCRFRETFVFPDAEPSGRRDGLWERDVAEVFLQPDRSQLYRYKEFEVAPNGQWLDMDVCARQFRELQSGLERSVHLDSAKRQWVAELKIPMKSLTDTFNPSSVWYVNFYRVEGAREPRTYLAWCPTNTPQPDFHVPTAFGRLLFASPTETGM